MTTSKPMSPKVDPAVTISALTTFWQRGRKQFVPLTIRDIEYRGGELADIRPLIANGLVKTKASTFTNNTIYEITVRGREVLARASAEAVA